MAGMRFRSRYRGLERGPVVVWDFDFVAGDGKMVESQDGVGIR